MNINVRKSGKYYFVSADQADEHLDQEEAIMLAHHLLEAAYDLMLHLDCEETTKVLQESTFSDYIKEW